MHNVLLASATEGKSIVNTKWKPHLKGCGKTWRRSTHTTDHPDRDVAEGGAGSQRGGSGDAPGGSWRSLNAGLYEATFNAATKAAASEG